MNSVEIEVSKKAKEIALNELQDAKQKLVKAQQQNDDSKINFYECQVRDLQEIYDNL